MRKLSKQLIGKSKESFLLSLELFNKPTIGFRIESFALLFINAWELLLKSFIYEKSDGNRNSIFYLVKKNEKRRSITLDQCLNKVFKVGDPARENIKYISDIRDESAHLIIEELEPYFSRVFQSGVLNYIEFIYKNFNINLTEELNPGFISLVGREKDLKNLSLLKNKVSKEDLDNIQSWVKRFNGLEQLGNKGAIPLVYKVALVNNPNKADITLNNSGAGGILTSAVIVEKSRDFDETHPFLTNAVLDRVNEKLIKIKLNIYDFQVYCFCKKIRITPKNEYFWSVDHASSRYSQKLIDEMTSYYSDHDKNILRSEYKKLKSVKYKK